MVDKNTDGTPGGDAENPAQQPEQDAAAPEQTNEQVTANTSEDKAVENSTVENEAVENDVVENKEGSGFDLNTVIEDAKRVATQPVEFYRQLPHSGGFAEPCIFLLVMAVAMGLLATLFSFFGLGVIGSIAIGFTSFIVLPIMALIWSFIGALIMFVIWKLMGSARDYEAAYRSIAYASVVYPITPLVSWIPYLGTIIVTGWGMYLIYIATMEVHGIKQQKAQLVIGILAAISLLMQLSAESTSRALQSSIEEPLQEWQRGMEQFNESIRGELTEEEAEQLGKQLGESLGQLGKAAEELSRNADSNEEMTPEEAGRALGSFFKGLSEGAQGMEQPPESVESEPAASVSSSAEAAASAKD